MLLPPLGNVAGTQAANIGEHFSELEDPRIDRRKRHLLIDIVVVAICGVICGAETWVDIENFGKAKLKWFKQFLELPNGIPSHDTFGRVFNCLDAEQFQRCFVGWMQAVSDIFKGQVIALDGKTLRRSHDKTIGKAAIHMVSAWALENQLVLGQVKVDEKSNEITAIPKLLEALAIAGCIVTIDALGCQKEIAQQIIDQGADYVLAPLKADPSPILPILEQLKFDESDSVRRSVANNLNDISKDNPGVVVDLLRRWRTHDTAEMRRIINHALRTLVKAGDPDALELLGYPSQPAVTVKNLFVEPDTVAIGEKLTFSFEIVSAGEAAQKLMVDYVMHLVRTKGKRTQKVFKLTKKTIAPGETLTITKRHSFQQMSTRKYYPGQHAIEIQINGTSFGRTEFTVR